MSDKKWSSEEEWAWEQIQAGKIADFNVRLGNMLDPKTPNGWGDDRTIGAGFLKKVFWTKRDEIPVEGVRIIGAFLPEGQALQSARLDRDVWFSQCRIGGPIDFAALGVDGCVSLKGSWIAGGTNSASLILNGAHVTKSLNLSYLTVEGDVLLQSTKIEGDLAMTGSNFERRFAGNGLHVGRNLQMNAMFQVKAMFRGDVDLTAAKIDGQLDMSGSTFEKTVNGNSLLVGRQLFMCDDAIFLGHVDLTNANIDGQVELNGSMFKTKVTGNALHVGRNLQMMKATFQGDVDLTAAKIEGELDMRGSTFEKTVNGNSLQVGQNLFMHGTFQGDVILGAAKIGGQLDLSGSTFEKTVNGLDLQVVQNLFLRKAAFHGDLSLVGAKIDGELNMSGSTFKQKVDGNRLQIGRDLVLHDETATFRGDVILRGARIAGQLDMSSSTFEKMVDGDSLEVGQDLMMRCATFRQPASFIFAHIGANLDLRGSTFAGLDLTGVVVGRELRLAGEGHPVKWLGPDQGFSLLKLRNVRVGTLQDSPDVWSALQAIDLGGFSYGQLGGFGATDSDDAWHRSVNEWKAWLARDGGSDRRYSAGPYAQLASVLTAAGRRDHANAILFAGRERERAEARRQHRWRRWLWLTFLWGVIGYGIGLYTFRVLIWIALSVAVGTATLWFFAPIAQANGFWWCVGASLDRLLPAVIQLNKEFADFFNDPASLRGCVKSFFVILRIWGWVLGSFLLAGLAGLTQRS
jgi:hypothetical protein